MKTIVVKPREAGSALYARAKASDVSQVVDGYALIVDEAGNPLVIYAPQEASAVQDLLHAFRQTKYKIGFRTMGLGARSITLGAQPRNHIRNDYCRSCAFASEYTSLHNVYERYAQLASEAFRDSLPSRFAKQQQVSLSVRADWRMGSSIYTSGIVNKDSDLAYHRDSGNFSDFWSSMYASAEGCSGGLLCVPELDLAFSFAQPALMIFDGAKYIRGVTPIKRRSPFSHRYSVVFYGLQQLVHCQSPEEELARVRVVKTRKERDRLLVRPPLFAQRKVGKIVDGPKVALAFFRPNSRASGALSKLYAELVGMGFHCDIIQLTALQEPYRLINPVPKLYPDDGSLSHVLYSYAEKNVQATVSDLQHYDIVVFGTLSPATSAEPSWIEIHRRIPAAKKALLRDDGRDADEASLAIINGRIPEISCATDICRLLGFR